MTYDDIRNRLQAKGHADIAEKYPEAVQAAVSATRGMVDMGARAVPDKMLKWHLQNRNFMDWQGRLRYIKQADFDALLEAITEGDE